LDLFVLALKRILARLVAELAIVLPSRALQTRKLALPSHAEHPCPCQTAEKPCRTNPAGQLRESSKSQMHRADLDNFEAIFADNAGPLHG
jgi:hypothetical protein